MMDKLTWEKLADVYGRIDAEVLASYLRAEGIDVELFQEAVGHHVFPVTIDGLGRVQVFVPKINIVQARELYELFKQGENPISIPEE
ncbi:MAG: hypothetical protein ABIJ39_04810 [Chloroflexota bacterium]